MDTSRCNVFRNIFEVYLCMHFVICKVGVCHIFYYYSCAPMYIYNVCVGGGWGGELVYFQSRTFCKCVMFVNVELFEFWFVCF